MSPDEITTPPTRKTDMQRYAWIVAAALSAGAGGGGFIGATAQNEKLVEEVREIKADIRAISSGISVGRERTTVLEMQYQTMARDIDKLREQLEALREARRR